MSVETGMGAQRPEPVASRIHWAIFLAIVAAVTALGWLSARHAAAAPATPRETSAIPAYVSAIVLEWLLAWFAWRGIRRRGGTLAAIVGGRWASARDVARDLALAALAWVAIALAGALLERTLGSGLADSLARMLPSTPAEAAVWALTCASAGFCEELVFRGYAQRQLLAYTGSVPAAVAGQAVVFALMHSYQGWRPVLEIAVIGAMFGALAAWRRTLRVGMVAHAWHDLWEGWLARALFT